VDDEFDHRLLEEVLKLAEAHGIEMLGPVPADAGYGRVRGAT